MLAYLALGQAGILWYMPMNFLIGDAACLSSIELISVELEELRIISYHDFMAVSLEN